MKKKQIIENIVHKSSLNNRQDYIKQYSILNSLIKKYDNEDFWDYFSTSQSVKSLFYFKTPNGRKIIVTSFKKFIFGRHTRNIKYKINKRKSGKNVSYNKNPKQTIRRFIDG